jgi:uncharacterized protein
MPMATDLRRRRLLLGSAALLLAGRAGATEAEGPLGDTHLVAAWDDATGGHHLGLLQVGRGQASVVRTIEVPTRCHGLACQADGSVLAVARRPGDWLLRWQPRLDKPPPDAAHGVQWTWAPAERRFNGHVLVAPDGRAVYTTEIDVDSGQGLLVQRDPATLEARQTWPTLGHDPHDIEWLPSGELLVANGGIQTMPETGRLKRALDQMDSSLARIHPARGEVTGQWRLPDPRLSLRHLARHHSGLVGVALQAEHDDPAARAAAPVFATFDPASGRLTLQAPDRPASGYAGDVAAMHDGWVVSCPRNDDLMHVAPDGSGTAHVRCESGCALAPGPDGKTLWALGRTALNGGAAAQPVRALPDGWQFDNHALLWRGAGRA